ncbi:chlorophyllase-1-like [Euphorbia lathyris]|uniref:chlorophyllase-1-like n=1 Tax=Euphorbia lathyris TaxID=212925 RepID=UPI003313830F
MMGKLIIIVVVAIVTVLNLSEGKPPKVEKLPDVQVFKPGIYPITLIEVNESSSIPIQIYTPNITTSFPVLLFLHGACLENSYYSTILQFVASYGYIVVAPQLYSCDVFVGPVSGTREVEIAANVTNWLSDDLNSVLPGLTTANLKQVTIGGHGRGGKTAFALALGHSPISLSIQFAALIGLDPVAGAGKDNEDNPKILTYIPQSFDLSIPVTVIGTGYGNQTNWCLICPVCAPNDVNHDEFYKETKAPVGHIVTTDYGHVDILDDGLEGIMGWVTNIKCKNGDGPKDKLRTTVAGTMVAFLNAYFNGFDLDYMMILQRPGVTPVTVFTESVFQDRYAQL